MTHPDHRTGILLHITSLPGPNPVTGTLGAEARKFIDTLEANHCHLWQMLPIGPVFDHRSPYESPSSIAGNPDLLDLQACVDAQWLPEARLMAAYSNRITLQQTRQEASQLFWETLPSDSNTTQRLRLFTENNNHWLQDFALFFALKIYFQQKPWWEWPATLKWRDVAALEEFGDLHKDFIDQIYFEQFIFSEQWRDLKLYAEKKGITLIGDLPIYVAHDSADVWASNELFALDDAGLCIEVAGVPPDYFSEDGQRWGNPLYRWEVHKKEGFNWWKQRVAAQAERFHSLRIDHFRGLESYWAIPAEQPDGKVGQWRLAPGDELLECLGQSFPDILFIAEDLGIITDEVNALRERNNLPGMKILQFAFDGSPDNPYLPANIEGNFIVYTGTHDNDTIEGWINTTDDETLRRAMAILHCTKEALRWAMIEAAIHSSGLWSIIPLQDVLGLDQAARMNTPGTIEGNWLWRFDESGFRHPGWQQLSKCIDMKESL